MEWYILVDNNDRVIYDKDGRLALIDNLNELETYIERYGIDNVPFKALSLVSRDRISLYDLIDMLKNKENNHDFK